MPGSSHIIDLTLPGALKKIPEGVYEVFAVNVIPHLFSFVSEDCIFFIAHGTEHQIGQEPMKFRATMGRASQAATTKNAGIHMKVFSIFLYQYIGGNLTCP